MSTPAFDDRGDTYDALIDWPKRLANEEPFYRGLFERYGVRRVLDAACGTGRHAALFHSWGCVVEGADVSPAMIAQCRRQFGESPTLRWAVRPFDQPVEAAGALDAAICVGNSLGLAADVATVARAVEQMLRTVRPGGVCVLQVLNLWRLPDGPTVWQKCKRVSIDGVDHVLVKGVHRAGSRGFVDLVDLTLSIAGVAPRYDCPMFLGLEAADLVRMAQQAGARDVRCNGDYRGGAYERDRSTDLIVVAER